MRADCPNCGKILRNPSGVVTLKDDLRCLSMAAREKEDLETEMSSEAADRERREYLDWTHGKKSGYGPDSFMCYMSDYD